LVILEKLHPPTALSYLNNHNEAMNPEQTRAVATFLNEV